MSVSDSSACGLLEVCFALTDSFFQAGADVKATREDGRDGDAKVSRARPFAVLRHRRAQSLLSLAQARIVARFREGNMALTRCALRHSCLVRNADAHMLPENPQRSTATRRSSSPP